MSETERPIVILSTASTGEEARRIAHALVEARVAACVQTMPITSTYRWKGAIEESGEVLLLIKTRAGFFEAVEKAILAIHSYEVPEILALETCANHAPYAHWLVAQTGPLAP